MTVTPECGHALCELIGGASCSLVTGRSRGCRPNVTAKTIEPAVFDEVRTLVGVIDANGAPVHAAAVRLAAIARRESLDDRNLVAFARSDEPDLAPALERLLLRRR